MSAMKVIKDRFGTSPRLPRKVESPSKRSFDKAMSALRGTTRRDSSPNLALSLTGAEIHLLHRIDAGTTSQQIAHDLRLTVGQVAADLVDIRGKLEVESTDAAIQSARTLISWTTVTPLDV